MGCGFGKISKCEQHPCLHRVPKLTFLVARSSRGRCAQHLRRIRGCDAHPSWIAERRGRMVRTSWVRIPAKARRGICEQDTLKSTARGSQNKHNCLRHVPLTSVKKKSGARFAYDVRHVHVARVSRKCCAHLPCEERATRDVTFGPL
jgi:hypothetical protein